MGPTRQAVVVGAHGVIGTRLIEELLTSGEWDVVGLSRRGGTDRPRLRHLAVDLLDPAQTRERLRDLTATTHVFYAAYQDRPSWTELVAPNLAMLTHTLDALEPIAPDLEHVSLMQGYKVYGAHLGRFKTPAREDDPPHLPPEFNVDQQALLEARSQGRPWSWTAIRPSVVCGTALGNPMNLAVVIGVYAAISKHLRVPLRFPGRPGAYDSLLELTDAGLLARATIWAATTPACAGEAFNIANGDLFRWNDLWPKVADYFELDVAPPLPLALADVMADKEPVWQAMREQHGLRPDYAQVSSWAFGDFVFSWDYDMFGDTSKARRYGFHDFVHTETMLWDAFDKMRAAGTLP